MYICLNLRDQACWL